MQNFIFENPTKIIFGQGQISMIGKEVSRFGRKVLMVYGRESIKRFGIYQQVTESLQKAGMNIVEFPDVKSNPVLSHTLKGIGVAREEKVDVILAVGGGSVIDTAKTIAAGVPADHDVWDFFTYRKTIGGALPLLTVLTVSASASEMNAAAVMTREEGQQKFSIRSPHIQPRVSILDPTVLFTLPPAYTAYSAVDAITHMLEPYFNNEEPDSVLQDRLVESLIQTIMECTETCLKEPDNYSARAKMMWATTWAFNGFTSTGMGKVRLPVHMIEHSLSAIYDIAHGAGLSIVLPAWMQYSIETNRYKLARLAKEIFAISDRDERMAAIAAIEQIKSWFKAIGSPITLHEAGIPEADIDRIAENASVLAGVWQLNDYHYDVIASILEKCKT